MDDALVDLHLQATCTGHNGGRLDDYIVEEPTELRDLSSLISTGEEKDGVFLGVYDVLWANQSASKISFWLPQTVVYRYNRPLAWYLSAPVNDLANVPCDGAESRVLPDDSTDATPPPRADSRASCSPPQSSKRTQQYKIYKKRPASLRNALILRAFLEEHHAFLSRLRKLPSRNHSREDPRAQDGSSPPVAGEHFVASYVSAEGISFFGRSDLQSFLLLARNKPDGVLQRFLPDLPCADGKSVYEMIRCAWSPSVCYVERRRNRQDLFVPTDKRTDSHLGTSIDWEAFTRVQTFEGTDNSREAPVTSTKNLKLIRDQCQAVASNFYAVTGGRLVISSAVVNLRLAANPQTSHGQPIFLWAEGVRVGSRRVPDALPSSPQHRTPNLAHVDLPDVPLDVSMLFSEDSPQKQRLSLSTVSNSVLDAPIKSSNALGASCAVTLQAYKPVTPSSSMLLEATRRLHPDLRKRGVFVCRVCRKEHPSCERTSATYRTLLCAADDVSWASPQRLRRAHRLLQHLVRPHRTPSPSGSGKLSGGPLQRGNTLSRMPSDIRGASSEAWRYKAFTSDTFTKPPQNKRRKDSSVSRHTAAILLEYPQAVIPKFVQALHPFMTLPQYVELRGREDFLQTNAVLCVACLCRLTSPMSSGGPIVPRESVTLPCASEFNPQELFSFSVASDRRSVRSPVTSVSLSEQSPMMQSTRSPNTLAEREPTPEQLRAGSGPSSSVTSCPSPLFPPQRVVVSGRDAISSCTSTLIVLPQERTVLLQPRRFTWDAHRRAAMAPLIKKVDSTRSASSVPPL